jgi:hypothetical protein
MQADVRVAYTSSAFAFDAKGRVTISDECDSMNLMGSIMIGGPAASDHAATARLGGEMGSLKARAFVVIPCATKYVDDTALGFDAWRSGETTSEPGMTVQAVNVSAVIDEWKAGALTITDGILAAGPGRSDPDCPLTVHQDTLAAPSSLAGTNRSLTVCSCYTSVPVHTRRVLLHGFPSLNVPSYQDELKGERGLTVRPSRKVDAVMRSDGAFTVMANVSGHVVFDSMGGTGPAGLSGSGVTVDSRVAVQLGKTTFCVDCALELLEAEACNRSLDVLR